MKSGPGSFRCPSPSGWDCFCSASAMDGGYGEAAEGANHQVREPGKPDSDYCIAVWREIEARPLQIVDPGRPTSR